MKLFVDDERLPPTIDKDWVLVRDAQIAIKVLETYPGMIHVLSLDHDLGDPIFDGYAVAAWLERQAASKLNYIPGCLRVHSANPVGRARIMQCFESIARLCETHGWKIPDIEA